MTVSGVAARLSRTRHRAGTAVLAKGQRRTETILDAATAILIEEGYAQLTTRKIATRARIRPGNLQYYYPAKHDVVRAVLDCKLFLTNWESSTMGLANLGSGRRGIVVSMAFRAEPFVAGG